MMTFIFERKRKNEQGRLQTASWWTWKKTERKKVKERQKLVLNEQKKNAGKI